MFYNERRHLELLEAERAEVRRELAAERDRELVERAWERERAVAVLEWYARHKDQLPDVPPPPGMERNRH